MGNTLIQDSTTGHIMGLSEGFVPVGLKEHGGIMYIASVNKEGKGEIGTIPSPILTLSQNQPKPEESREATLVHENGPDHNLTILSDYKIAPGEKFLIGLELTVGQQETWYNKPMITCFDGENIVRGMYNIKLYTVYDTNSVCLDKLISTPQKYWITDEGLNTSDYWFIPSDKITNIDINKTYIVKEFKTYPGNIPAGRLAIKVELENIDSFSLMKAIQTEGINKGEATLAPRVTKGKDGDYILDFPGFDYQTSSARFVGKVEFCLYDQKTKQEVYNSENTWQGGLVIDENSTLKIRDHETLEWHYQIRQSVKPALTQKPLFSYNIGKNLNNWYQIVVTYYDQFGGKIDTYKYSFNPYHVLNFDESYQLRWKQGLKYEQLYNTSTEGNVSIFTETGINLNANTSIKAYLSKGQQFSPQTDNPYIKFSRNYGSEGGYADNGDDFAPVASLNTRELEFQDITSSSMFVTLPSVNNLNYLYDRPQFKFTPIDETSKCDITWSLSGNLFLNEYSSNLFSISVLNRIIYGRDNISPYNASYLFTADGQLNYNNYYCQVQNTITTPSIIVGNEYNGESIQLLSNLNVKEVELYDGNTAYDEKGNYQDSGITDITISAQLKGPQDCKWQLILSNTSDYAIIPSFSLYGDSDNKFDMTMGLDRNGRPQPAWTFGKSLLTSVSLQTQNKNSSFVKTVEYLPSDNSITQILYPGTYLLNLNAYSDSGSLSIKIEGDSYVTEIENKYFTPQLIYLSKEMKVEIFWEDIDKMRNIGLYQLSKPVWVADRSRTFGDGEVYAVIDYQHPDLSETSEVILPLEATYYEEASCYTMEYEYYNGPSEAYMTDRHKLANGDVLSFIYKWDENNTDTAEVSQITDFETVEGLTTLTYRHIIE